MAVYIGTGGIRAAGCANARRRIKYILKFAEGSTAYLCYKAKKGVLESVVIKRVRLVSNSRTFNKVVPIYTDTLNAIFNEEELCTGDEALAAATLYLAERAAQAKSLFEQQSCAPKTV